MHETYWIGGYKISAASLGQAKVAAEQLARYGVKPDYCMPDRERFAACVPNPVRAA